MNKIYLFLLTLFAAVGLNANAAKPTKLNLFDWNQTIQLTNESDGVFTGEYTVGTASQFRFVNPDNNNEFGAEGNDSDRTPTTNNTLNFKQTGSTFLIKNLSQGTKLYFKVTFTSDTEGTVKFQSTPFTSGGGDTTFGPSILYIMGDNVNGNSLWNSSTSSQFPQASNNGGKFEFTNVVLAAADGDSYAYVRLTKDLSSKYGTNQYGISKNASGTAVTGNTVVAAGATTTGSNNNENCWKILPGTYDITATFTSESELTLVFSEPDTTPSQLTIYGDINGAWSSMAGVKDGSKFTFTGVNILKSGDTSGVFRFSAGSSDSSDIYGTTYSYNQQISFSNGATTTSVAFKALGSTVHDYIISNGTYDIVVDFSDNHVYITKSEVVTPPTPTGSDIYVWFGAYWSTPNAMTADGDWWTYDYTATAKGTLFFNFSDANNPGSDGYWDAAAFASHRIGNTGTADAAITANGASLSAGTNSGKPYKLAVTAGWTYKIMISKSSPYTVKVTTENVEEDLDLDNTTEGKYWYLSGDINTWSSILEKSGGRTPGHYFYGEDEISNTTKAYTGTDPQNEGYKTPEWRSNATTYNYRPEAGEDYKRFLTTREMNEQFRFRRVTQADVDALGSYTKAGGHSITANTGTDTGGWWVLDLSKAVDTDGNPARLCGQFKIIAGSLVMNSENYAFSGTDNLTEALEVGKMSDKIAINKDPNMTIKPTVIENAKIYFTPDNGGLIMVTGDARTLYLYYVDFGVDNATSAKPTAGKQGTEYKYYNEGKQLNYSSNLTVNQSDWEETTMAVAKADLPESLSILADMDLKVWRLPIHPSLIHRSPMPFTAAIKSAKTEFAPVALHCDNEWFAEGDPVNLYLRYEDETLTPEAMYCNTYYNKYENGEMVGVRYQHRTYEKMAAPQTYENIPDAYKPYKWFKSGDVTALFANGGYALFASSRGEMYPVGGINAVGTERARVALNGVDLFYVIPSATQLNILYNHLNGTFNTSDKATHNNKIQINAELFQEAHPLFGDHIDFTMDGSVTYRFRVYHLDSTSEEMNKIADSGVIAQPFYDWDVKDCGVGYYQVLVTATRGGKTYQAYDVYSIAE